MSCIAIRKLGELPENKPALIITHLMDIVNTGSSQCVIPGLPFSFLIPAFHGFDHLLL